MRPTRDAPERDRPIKARDSRPRWLIAGLRVTEQDEISLAAVRPLFPDAVSEGELAYRLWRRGLEITLAEAASLGVALPPGTSEERIASSVAQRILLSVPLLRRTGTLALIGFEGMPPSQPLAMPAATPAVASASDTIDDSAAAMIAGLGGSDFL